MKTTITLAIVALLAATAARAEVITKGGASGLMKAPALVRTETPAPAMRCAACTSEYVTVRLPTFKGTVPETAIVERHACKTCGTKWVTTGHGKAKVEVAQHTCGACKM